jgi:UDP-GlcNAc:undecaprenyl-phosphate GlcNAc-1-phosphate transferase
MLIWTFAFIVGVTNAVNLSDGLDGLAAGNSLLSFVLLAVLAAEIGHVDYVVLALATAGGLLGFLRFNTHPARLFMGDSGSQFLGFTGAALAVLILREESMPYSAMLPVLIFGLPILDTLSVMAVRKLRGRPMFKADRSHLHHQLLALGLKHYEVVAVLYVLQGIVVLLAYQFRYASDLTLLMTYGAFCAAVLGGILACRLAGWRAHAPSDAVTERRNLWLRNEWYHYHTAKVLGALVAALFLGGAVYAAGFSAGATEDVADLALVTAAALGAAAIWFRGNPEFVGRLVTFVVAAFALYGFLFGLAERPELNLAIDAYFVLLALLLALAIRVTRKSQFHLDTQDYLVLFIVAVVPFLPIAEFDGLVMARAVLRAAVLLYACEYVVTKGGGSRWLLTGAGIVSLAILGFSRQEYA